MQTRVGNIVGTDGGGNGAHITDVLHDGCQGNGSDGDYGGDQHAHIQRIIEDGQRSFLPDNGQTEPLCSVDGGGNVCPGSGIDNHGSQIRGNHTQQNGNNLDHALAPDVADYHDEDGNQSNQPVAGAVIDSALCQRKTDADDDWAGDDGREVAHDLLDTEDLEEQCQNQIQQAGNGNTEAGVGQGNVLAGSGDQAVGTQKRKGRTQKSGDFAAGDQVEQQRTQTCKQQCGRDIQAGDGGNQHGCAEHCKQMLHAEKQHFGRAERSCVVYGFLNFVLVFHSFLLSFLPMRAKKKRPGHLRDSEPPSLNFHR